MSFEVRLASGDVRVVRDAAFDNRPRGKPLPGQAAEALVDEQGRAYRAFFDGHDVYFAEGSEWRKGRWALGSWPVRIRGGPPLDARFLFTFFDHGRSARLNALWEFDGRAEEAVSAFVAAGFSRSRHDARLKGGKAGRVHLRTEGSWATGGDSAHAILYESADGRTTGEIHVGEHNPLRGFGIGFLLHQWEIRWK